MALLEINLEKPALMSERKASGESSDREREQTEQTGRTTTDVETGESSSKRSRVGPALGLLVTTLVATFVGRKVRARRKSKAADGETEERESASSATTETEPTEAKSSGGRRRKAVGGLGALLAIAFLASRLRKRGSN